MTIAFENKVYEVAQNVIDPGVSKFVKEESNVVAALLLTHVDNLMLMGAPKLAEHLQKELKKMFPVEDWEEDQ